MTQLHSLQRLPFFIMECFGSVNRYLLSTYPALGAQDRNINELYFVPIRCSQYSNGKDHCLPRGVKEEGRASVRHECTKEDNTLGDGR